MNKVAGNFHVAPGKAFQSPQGQLVHEFKPFDTHTYNVRVRARVRVWGWGWGVGGMGLG